MMLPTHEEQSECGASVTSGLEENLGQGLTSDRAGDGRDITQGEHDDDQEGESEGSAVCQSYVTEYARMAYLSMTPYTLLISAVR